MYPNKLFRIKEFIRNKIFKKGIIVKNNINFGSSEANRFFKTVLAKSDFYFEYGSGSSTILANNLNKKFISIESDLSFFKLMISKNIKNIKYVSIGLTLNYSYPLIILRGKVNNYIKSINKIFNNRITPDLILIDGRFRVACCLNLLNFKNKILKKKTVILLDDYEKRLHYRVLENFFLIKKKGRMALLKPKSKKKFKKYFFQFLIDPR